MKILYVGCTARLRLLSNVLGAATASHRVTHCVDGEQAVAALSQPGRRFDWVIMDDQAMAGGACHLARTICVMGPLRQERVEPGSDVGSRCLRRPDGPACGIEQRHDGVVQLRCGLHELAKSGVSAQLGEIEGDGFSFEYQGPVFARR